ncbi:MAG: glycosyl-4,4'-diaponeurosporenoate acyltransferase [Chloroflexota bacterium]|jgi:glycosyl-4,4'-diaponeurosporenoate acyltransferase|nr:glycosyl-4,4'-diaponeurosporenoate acyltransferase [Chloroflexota bacterium]
MQTIFLETPQTIVLDVIAWVIFHLGIGFGCSKIPLTWLNPDSRFFQTFKWEKDGKIYQKLFHVQSWKQFIPNAANLFSDRFPLKSIKSKDPQYLIRWLKETIRSEICHWLMIVPGFFFFLWNDVILGWLMVAYAFLNNLPFIIVQRFNRPRIRKLIALTENSQSSKS